jgi:phosphoribosylanthranilate isomerase
MLNGNLKLKICGMREPDNISEVSALKPDYMGFIFYPESPRFVNTLSYNMAHLISILEVEPVAVFVNASIASIRQITELYSFTTVQLHGNETPEICIALREYGLKVIKAFSINDRLDLEETKPYRGCCDYFLFDTKTPEYGGSGIQYNWRILQDYNGATPFFLSGGIGPNDTERILTFKHPGLLGIDINSRFEIKPALKDVRLISTFINQLNSLQ